MEILPVIAILIEIIVVLVGLMLAINKKKVYGWLFALSYALYIVYDMDYSMPLGLNHMAMNVTLIAGAASTLVAVCLLFKELKKPRR